VIAGLAVDPLMVVSRLKVRLLIDILAALRLIFLLSDLGFELWIRN
ncbi:unnamed protein product, partial [Acidithrix sp. C25]